MSLYEKLQQAKSEEDVKDAYIKALGLRGVSRNLIDIQTKEIWFEAKVGGKVSTYAMFTQLLHYIQQAMNKGEEIPPFLCVIDSVKAAIMKTDVVIPFLAQKTIKWGRSASSYTQDALDAVSAFIGTHFVSYRIETHEKEFIEQVRAAIRTGEIIRLQITPDNLKQVFDKWVAMIGCEIKDVNPEDYNLLFFADIMSDGTVSTHDDLPAELIHRNNKPAFLLDGKLFELGSREGYRQFWSIYDRPPREEYRNYLLERRDSLIPLDERSFKGAYYTPLHVVDKAYDLLTQTLGANWQREYTVWDMCCGVGNLETKHSNPRNLYMSTLDQSDVDVMCATKTCVRAERFQYDYLNDDITDDGTIDYTLTDKIPQGLRRAIVDHKKILVLINPPYAEAGKGMGAGTKGSVAKTKWAETGMNNYGKASNELFTQFVARIYKEIPNAVLAMFSKLKYVNASNFEQFRSVWHADYLGGFIVHSKAFDGLKGDFPIGFLVWRQTDKKSTFPDAITCEILNKDAEPIGEKTFYNIPVEQYLTNWIQRPKPNKELVIPLKNCITPADGLLSDCYWSSDAVAHMLCDSNDFQNAGGATAIFSSTERIGHKGGFYVNAENLWQAAVVFTARRIIKPTWINDRDQFLQPSVKLSDEFCNDCLIWMLFHGSNLTASADGLEWNGRKWSIVNHFIPYNEEEVGAPGRFESDFTVQYLADKTLSTEARAELDAGRLLWQAYFAQTDEYTVREKLCLNRPDVGWYQIRNALKERNESSVLQPVNFTPFGNAYSTLSDKIRPQILELGFLK